MHSQWKNRRSAAEFISRRTIEMLVMIWIGRDPERRTRFEQRIRFEGFDAAVQVMQLSEHDLHRWRGAIGMREDRAGLNEHECPSLEDSWQIARAHWRREPLLAEDALLLALKPVIHTTMDILRSEGRELAPAFEQIAQRHRVEDPFAPRLVDRFGRPSRVGWKVIDEARFRLLATGAHRIAARAA